MRFSDHLGNLIGDAVTDIRGKLVEEGWFGRALGEGRSDYEAMLKAWHGEAPERGRGEPSRDPEIDMER